MVGGRESTVGDFKFILEFVNTLRPQARSLKTEIF